MQRRIGLAQALINNPELILLDEPTSGLDPIGTAEIKDLIRELQEPGQDDRPLGPPAGRHAGHLRPDRDPPPRRAEGAGQGRRPADGPGRHADQDPRPARGGARRDPRGDRAARRRAAWRSTTRRRRSRSCSCGSSARATCTRAAAASATATPTAPPSRPRRRPTSSRARRGRPEPGFPSPAARGGRPKAKSRKHKAHDAVPSALNRVCSLLFSALLCALCFLPSALLRSTRSHHPESRAPNPDPSPPSEIRRRSHHPPCSRFRPPRSSGPRRGRPARRPGRSRRSAGWASGATRASPIDGPFGPVITFGQDRRAVLAARLDLRLGDGRPPRPQRPEGPVARRRRARLGHRPAAGGHARRAPVDQADPGGRPRARRPLAAGDRRPAVRHRPARLDRAGPLGDDRSARQAERSGRPRHDPPRDRPRTGRRRPVDLARIRPDPLGPIAIVYGCPPRRDLHGTGRPGAAHDAGPDRGRRASGRGGSTRSPSSASSRPTGGCGPRGSCSPSSA